MVSIIIIKINIIISKYLIKSSCTLLKFINPFLIFWIGIPTDKATPNAPTEFLILCIPSNGILIFFILIVFLFGKLISTSNLE